MKDKGIIWITAGGIAIWIFVAYPPFRDAVVRTLRHLMQYVADQF